jgi:hypothetical protein
MKIYIRLLAIALISLAGVARSQTLANFTGDGTPIMGLNESGSYSTTGYSYNQYTDTPPNNSVDNNPYTFDATYYDNGNYNHPTVAYDSSYIGIDGAALLTATATQPVTTIQLTLALFHDGGWFGEHGTDTSETTLSAGELIAPTVQITTDGTDWTTVAMTTASANAYVTSLENTSHVTETNSPLLTFTLVTPQYNIEGIRLIGTDGGYAGNGDGFLGVIQFSALDVPEPSTYALIGLGMGGLFVVGRFLRRASAL